MKVRLDRLLVDRGYFPSGEKARRAVMAGLVAVDGRIEGKPGRSVPAVAGIAVAAPPRYVGRGGEKLAAAVERFGVRVAGRRCLDIGASTGGFTDCLLQEGATAVVALDVGRGQLADRLRRDPRVVVMERTNARALSPGDLPYRPALVTVDVSFISLDRILPAVAGVLRRGGEIVALVKPQFEAGRAEVKRGGVVRDPLVHARVIWRVCDLFERSGFVVRGIMESPLRGPAGNREFFIHATLAHPPGARGGGDG
ncbi:MAG: TlyA family RNA methyltransferase [bacterium]|nr:TlyA family RNA methyltransferase [bacterium]